MLTSRLVPVLELYERRQGSWYRVGNVSNFKP
jgi:hypothetical protein